MPFPKIPYFIQYWNLTYQDLENRDFRMAIMDDDHTPLTTQQINSLQNQSKLLIPYLSIGEAEADRPYWQEAGWSKEHMPSWVVEQNPEWGSYRVAFWDEAWQQLTIERAKTLIAKGYDGLFLDVVDVYDIIKDQFPQRDVERDMIDFVRRIAAEVRAIKPKALIIPNNGLSLLDKPAYLEVIDGVAKESTFYNAYREHEGGPVIYQVPEWKEWDLKLIRPVSQPPINKFVLVIEYPNDPALQHAVMEEAGSHQFVPFIGTYRLDELPGINAEYYTQHPFNYRAAHFVPPSWPFAYWAGGLFFLCLLVAWLARRT